LRVVAEEAATEEVYLANRITILSNLFQADVALREFHTRRAFFLDRKAASCSPSTLFD